MYAVGAQRVMPDLGPGMPRSRPRRAERVRGVGYRIRESVPVANVAPVLVTGVRRKGRSRNRGQSPAGYTPRVVAC